MIRINVLVRLEMHWCLYHFYWTINPDTLKSKKLLWLGGQGLVLKTLKLLFLNLENPSERDWSWTSLHTHPVGFQECYQGWRRGLLSRIFIFMFFHKNFKVEDPFFFFCQLLHSLWITTIHGFGTQHIPNENTLAILCILYGQCCGHYFPFSSTSKTRTVLKLVTVWKLMQ